MEVKAGFWGGGFPVWVGTQLLTHLLNTYSVLNREDAMLSMLGIGVVLSELTV